MLAPHGWAPSIPPSILPSRLGPSMGGRTWPRSPRRGGFSSLGKWPGKWGGGSWETQNVLGHMCTHTCTHPQPLPAVEEWDGVAVGSSHLLGGLLPSHSA